VKRTLLSVLLWVAASGFACAADATVAGKWNIHSVIQGYEGDLECNLTQDGVKVSGTCKSAQQPGVSLEMTGKVEDRQVTLQYNTQYNGDELTIVYTAKLENADKFSGLVNVLPMQVGGEFTATLVK
jgi:hypothetical protein